MGSPEVIYRHSKNPSRQRLWHLLLLTLPFIAVIVYSKGLSGSLPVARYLTYDEGKFHYPTILQFAKEFPYFNLQDYNSATTPLYHLLMALLQNVFNGDLLLLRWVSVIISYLAVVVLYKILAKRLSVPHNFALLLSLIFLSAPYFFGASFVIQPGNAAVLLLLLTINSYLKFKVGYQARHFIWAMFFMMLCLLCRQTYLYLSMAIGLDLLLHTKNKVQLIKYYVLMLVALLPLVALIVLWEGLTPPSFSSAHTEAGLINIKALEFGLVILGLYFIFLLPSDFYPWLPGKKLLAIAGLAVASILLLFLVPLQGKDNELSGNIPRIATKLPSLFHTSFLYFLLVPAGTVALYLIILKQKLHFFVLLLLCFFISNLPSKIIFQRYFDTAIILVLILANAPGNIQSRWTVLLKYVLLAMFAGYFLVYSFIDIS